MSQACLFVAAWAGSDMTSASGWCGPTLTFQQTASPRSRVQLRWHNWRGFVKVVAKGGRRDDLVVALNEPFDHLLTHEPKCEANVVHLDNDDLDAVWVYELFSGPDGLVDHRASSVLARLRTDVFPQIVTEVTAWHWGTPLFASGLTAGIRPLAWSTDHLRRSPQRAPVATGISREPERAQVSNAAHVECAL